MTSMVSELCERQFQQVQTCMIKPVLLSGDMYSTVLLSRHAAAPRHKLLVQSNVVDGEH